MEVHLAKNSNNLISKTDLQILEVGLRCMLFPVLDGSGMDGNRIHSIPISVAKLDGSSGLCFKHLAIQVYYLSLEPVIR